MADAPRCRSHDRTPLGAARRLYASVCHDPAVNALDVIAVLLVIVAVIFGARSGALPQLAGLAGAGLGALAGFTVLPIASGFLDNLEPTVRAIFTLGILLGLVGLGE